MEGYVIITFLHFDILFRTNQKFIYTFLEIFEKSAKILVFGFSDNYDFLRSTDPRIISRFPKKTYLFEKTNYFAAKEWFEDNTKEKNSKNVRKIVLGDKTFKALLETSELLGSPFKQFESSIKRYFSDLLWYISKAMKDKLDSYGEIKLKPNQTRDNCTNYLPLPSNEEEVEQMTDKIIEERAKLEFAQNKRGSVLEKKELKSVSKAVSDSHVVNVASKVHKVCKRLKECHLVTLLGFFEAKKKYGSKITFENIYLKYCNNLGEEGLIKQDPITVSVYLKEMVALDLLFQIEERGKTYYDIQGSFSYMSAVFNNIASDAQINLSIKEKLQRITF